MNPEVIRNTPILVRNVLWLIVRKKPRRVMTHLGVFFASFFFHYGQNNGTSTLKIGEQSVEVSHDYQQWRWWVWVLIIVPALVLLCLCMKCLCR